MLDTFLLKFCFAKNCAVAQFAHSQTFSFTKRDVYSDGWLLRYFSPIRLYYNLKIYKWITYTIYERIVHLEWCFLSVLKRCSKITQTRAIFENFEKYGVFKALYLTIETGYHLFDTFSSKTKHNAFVWWIALRYKG